jgi:hypothetical protein
MISYPASSSRLPVEIQKLRVRAKAAQVLQAIESRTELERLHSWREQEGSVLADWMGAVICCNEVEDP